MNLADLRKPFPPDRISWRVGPTTVDKKKGQALAYIDARDVMGRLDEVAGAYWQCEYIPMPNGTCCCRIGLKVGEEWIWRSNGAINLTDSDKPDQKEMTEKGSYSDAFKRAAVLWGIGQYLYDLDSPWVELDEKKRILKSEMPRLIALLGGRSPASRYGDADGQAKAWKDQQIRLIQGFGTLPGLYTWLEKKCGAGGTITDPLAGSDMDKAKTKTKALYDEIVQAFNAQLQAINRKENAA